MAKPKRSSNSGGARKKHGPKRHLFRDLKPQVHQFAKLGLLDKYHAEESFMLAVTARGNRKVSHADWLKFKTLSFEEQQKYFAELGK